MVVVFVNDFIQKYADSGRYASKVYEYKEPELVFDESFTINIAILTAKTYTGPNKSWDRIPSPAPFARRFFPIRWKMENFE